MCCCAGRPSGKFAFRLPQMIDESSRRGMASFTARKLSSGRKSSITTCGKRLGCSILLARAFARSMNRAKVDQGIAVGGNPRLNEADVR